MSILVLYLFPEPLDLLLHGVMVPTFKEVVESRHQQYPHRAPLTVVVYLPGMQKIRNSGTWYGDPVHVKCVRGAGDTLLSGLVKGMELTRGETDIQPRGQPVLVGYLACRTEVVQVVHLVLNTLQDPHLFSRVVDVVDGDGRFGLTSL